MSVSATFDYQPAEHYRALRTITKLTPLRWVVPALAIGVPAVFVALQLIMAQRAGRAVADAAPAMVPYILLGVFWLALIPWSQRRRARKLPALDASVHGPQERRVDSDGYHARGNGVGVDVPWHAFKKAVETEQFFLFFYNWQCAYYLPKRSLSADEVRRVRVFARAGLGEQARLMTT